MEEIDIVDIKLAVKERQLRFYVADNNIYVINSIGEVVKVGEIKGGQANE